MKYLLDVNALIAAVWQTHVHFSRTTAWRKDKSLVTCPFSELGFLRISTSRSFGLPMEDARAALEKFIKETGTEFIPADLPALESSPETSAQVTDIYLAELASRHGMKLATLDTGIKHPAVEGI